MSDSEALNMLIIKLASCPLDQLNIMIILAKGDKIKDLDYSLAKFVNALTSWASSEVDKPSDRYQSLKYPSPSGFSTWKKHQREPQ